MNSAHVARLLRELADAIEAEEPANDVKPKAKPLPRRPVNDMDRARARKALRRLGVVE